MSSKPISELNQVIMPTATDMLPIVNNFETKKISVQDLLASEVGIRVGYVAVAASPYSVGDTDSQLIVDTSGGDITVQLGAAASNNKRNLWIKNIGTGIVTVDADGAETIDGSLTKLLAQYSCMHIMCDGTDWWIL